MKKYRYVLLLGLVLAPLAAQAAGDPVAGKSKATVCFTCHGEDGNSGNPRYPKLGGQLAGYIVKQTLDFKHGRRTDAIMSAVVNLIPDAADMEDIGAYFASQELMRGDGRSDAIAERGRQLFVVERCVFCHGEGAKPTEPFVPGAPVIGGQHEQYLLKALHDIRAGTRNGDIYGIMQKTLARLADEDIAALAAFLGSL